MSKKYIVRLSKREREELADVTKRPKGHHRWDELIENLESDRKLRIDASPR